MRNAVIKPWNVISEHIYRVTHYCSLCMPAYTWHMRCNGRCFAVHFRVSSTYHALNGMMLRVGEQR